ncbi:aminopeptidase N isoform X2 [Cephus cinctus]|uniref:Aminopeptidase N isoform X2 n=1 Tax=Cephus cinctus TaxID=211228 RepID=A0AAJ7BWS0_CEPCN|nr:aminopeptidase N isoform X2 [Cephus cinctus]
MRRGSVSTWEPWARRNSANMDQFTGSRSEFMTAEPNLNNIKYQRKGGCFLSHKIALLIIVFVVVGIIVAGFAGAYISLYSKKEVNDHPVLAVEDDDMDGNISEKFTLSPNVVPMKYELKLAPVFNGEVITKIKGLVVIKLQQNSSDQLDHLTFNAKDMTIKNCKLLRLNATKTEIRSHRNRRYPTEEDVPAGSGTSALENTENTTSELMENSKSETPYFPDGANADPENVTTSDSSNDTLSDNSSTDRNITKSTTSAASLSSIDKSVSVSLDTETTKIVQTGSTDRATASDEFTNTDQSDIDVVEIRLKGNETDNVNGIYVMYLESPISNGIYSLEIIYETDNNNSALSQGSVPVQNMANRSSLGDGSLITHFKPTNARYFFPLFDDVHLKAKFTLSITSPSNLLVLANTPLKSRVNSSSLYTMNTFEETPLLSPHSLTFAVGDIELMDNATLGDTDIRIWGKNKNLSKSHFVTNMTRVVMELYMNFFSIDYPMSKIDIVSLPTITDQTGNLGLISVKESFFNITENSSSIVINRGFQRLIYSIGQQWLGGYVTMYDWTSSWILESSLIYLQRLLLEKARKPLNYINNTDTELESSLFFLTEVQEPAMMADGYATSRSLQFKFNPVYWNSIEIQNLHRKGACLIRMLHNVITDNAFKRGYKKFISRWTYANAEPTDFWQSMSEDVKNLPEDTSLMKIMESWTGSSGFPVINVTRNYDLGSVKLQQSRFLYDQSNASNDQLWYIPLTYTTKTGNWSSPKRIWFKPEVEMILHDVTRPGEKSWLIFNIDKFGYYRVNYDKENWELLSVVLNTNHQEISSATRASIIDDVFSLARAGLTSYETAFDIIRYFRVNERNSVAWLTLWGHIKELNSALYDTMEYSNFQGFIHDMITPLCSEVSSNSTNETELTPMIIEWASMVQHEGCLNWLKNNYPLNLSDDSMNNETTVSGNLREAVHCVMAKYGDQREWRYIFVKAIEKLNAEEKYDLLKSLACFQVPWILRTILGEVLFKEYFTENEILTVLQAFAQQPVASRVSYEYMRNNWQQIFERYYNSSNIIRTLVLVSTETIASDQDLLDLQSFKEKYYNDLKSIAHTIVTIEARTKSWNSWRNVSLPIIKKWLTNYKQ